MAGNPFTPFPAPTFIAKRRYWSKGDIRRYRAALRGEEHSPLPDDEAMINARQVRAEFANCSDMWLWRRLREAQAAAGSDAA